MSGTHNATNDPQTDNYKSLQSQVTTGFTSVPIYVNQNVPVLQNRATGYITNASLGTVDYVRTADATVPYIIGHPTTPSSTFFTNPNFQTTAANYLFKLPVRGIYIISFMCYFNGTGDLTLATNKQVRINLIDDQNNVVATESIFWSNGTHNITLSCQVDNAVANRNYQFVVSTTASLGATIITADSEASLVIALLYSY